MIPFSKGEKSEGQTYNVPLAVAIEAPPVPVIACTSRESMRIVRAPRTRKRGVWV
jgi:hypothetical protein